MLDVVRSTRWTLVLDLGERRCTLDVGRGTLDVGTWTLDIGHGTLGVGRWNVQTLHVEHLTLDVGTLGRSRLDVGRWWTLVDIGTFLDVRRWTLDAGHGTWDVGRSNVVGCRA